MRALLRYAWAAPCTLVGLCLAAPAVIARRATGVVVDGVVEVAFVAASTRTRRWLPFNAICFGHVVIGLSRAELARLRRHEHAHVRQYERWGVLFFLAYPLASLWQWLRGRRAYRDNGFEVQARAQEASRDMLSAPDRSIRNIAMNILVNMDVPDADAAARFYEAAVGLRRGRTLDGDVVELLGASSTIYLLQKPERDFARHWTPVHMDFVVPDVDAAAERALRAGAKRESDTVDWKGSRCITFADPFGHGFCLIEFEAGGTYTS